MRIPNVRFTSPEADRKVILLATRAIMSTAIALAFCVAMTFPFYVAAYFALARPGVTFQVAGRWAASAEYRGVPEIMFRPVHHLDRTFFRPRLWAGTFSEAQQAEMAHAVSAFLRAELKQP